jgi:predicted Zn-dependent peptidase
VKVLPPGARLWWLTLLLATLFLLGAAPTLAVRAAGPVLERSVLPNGLTLVTEQRPDSRVAGLTIAVRAGSRFEDEHTDSAAHLLEHLYLQGTALRPDRTAIVQPITAVGGSLSVDAGWELLQFSSSLRAADLDVAIDLLADLLQGSQFDPDRFEKERSLAQQELAGLEDDPASLALETLQAELFADQPLGHLPSGSDDGLTRLSRADLLAFRDRYVGPNRATIGLVSPFSHADLATRLGAALGGWPAASAGPASPPTDYRQAHGGQRVDLQAGSEQARVLVGISLPGAGHADRVPLLVLEAALNGFSGRLIGEIREQRGLAYDTAALHQLTSDAGYFAVYAGTPPASAEQVLTLLQAELERLRNQPLPEPELRRAIGRVVGGLLVDDETASSRAARLASENALGYDGSSPAFLERVRAVSAVDVQRVAQTYLTPNRQLDVVVQP